MLHRINTSMYLRINKLCRLPWISSSRLTFSVPFWAGLSLILGSELLISLLFTWMPNVLAVGTRQCHVRSNANCAIVITFRFQRSTRDCNVATIRLQLINKTCRQLAKWLTEKYDNFEMFRVADVCSLQYNYKQLHFTAGMCTQ